MVPDRCQRTAGRQALLALPTNELDGNLRPMWPTPAGAPAAAGISSRKVSRLI